MSNFPLIKSLQTKNDKTELPPGHKYKEFNIVVENQELSVFIPIKESEIFETKYNQLKDNSYLDKYHFNKLMREVRGIRG